MEAKKDFIAPSGLGGKGNPTRVWEAAPNASSSGKTFFGVEDPKKRSVLAGRIRTALTRIDACGDCFLCVYFSSLPDPPYRLPMAAKPIFMENWMLHHSDVGVRCVGAIRNHPKFPDGSFVRTSVVVARFPGGIITENGSSYTLGNKHPQNGVQSQGLYLSLPNAMDAQHGKLTPRPAGP